MRFSMHWTLPALSQTEVGIQRRLRTPSIVCWAGVGVVTFFVLLSVVGLLVAADLMREHFTSAFSPAGVAGHSPSASHLSGTGLEPVPSTHTPLRPSTAGGTKPVMQGPQSADHGEQPARCFSAPQAVFTTEVHGSRQQTSCVHLNCPPNEGGQGRFAASGLRRIELGQTYSLQVVLPLAQFAVLSLSQRPAALHLALMVLAPAGQGLKANEPALVLAKSFSASQK